MDKKPASGSCDLNQELQNLLKEPLDALYQSCTSQLEAEWERENRPCVFDTTDILEGKRSGIQEASRRVEERLRGSLGIVLLISVQGPWIGTVFYPDLESARQAMKEAIRPWVPEEQQPALNRFCHVSRAFGFDGFSGYVHRAEGDTLRWKLLRL